MFAKLFNSSIFNSWFNTVILTFSSLIAIPIVISNLNVEEINIWLLFASVIALSQGVLFGFNGTFSRFITYSNSGVRIKEFKNLKHKKEFKFETKINVIEFGRIFFLMKRMYVFLSSIYFLTISISGFFILKVPIESLINPNTGWVSFIIIVTSTTITLMFGYYQILLEGINKVALVQRISGIVNFLGLFIILGILFFYPTLISIIFIYQFVALCITISVTFFARKELKSINIGEKTKFFDKELFSVVWESAWKSGITTIIANIVRHISAILVAQLFSPAVSASFLFTKRIFDILERFTMSSFMARIPSIASFRGRGDFKSLLPYLKQTMYISYGVFLFGYISLLMGNQYILPLIKSNVDLGSPALIILFSFSTLLTRWAGMTLSVSNQANNIVEHINILISGIVFFIIVCLLYSNLGVNVFPFAQAISMITIIPLIAKMVYSSINTSFWSYENKVIVPVFGILVIINIIYYWY